MNETRELEGYLLKAIPPEDQLLVGAKLLLDLDLREKAIYQAQTYSLIQQYGRKKLKAEIEAVHTRLFNEKKFETFKQRILSIFKK